MKAGWFWDQAILNIDYRRVAELDRRAGSEYGDRIGRAVQVIYMCRGKLRRLESCSRKERFRGELIVIAYLW